MHLHVCVPKYYQLFIISEFMQYTICSPIYTYNARGVQLNHFPTVHMSPSNDRNQCSLCSTYAYTMHASC